MATDGVKKCEQDYRELDLGASIDPLAVRGAQTEIVTEGSVGMAVNSYGADGPQACFVANDPKEQETLHRFGIAREPIGVRVQDLQSYISMLRIAEVTNDSAQIAALKQSAVAKGIPVDEVAFSTMEKRVHLYKALEALLMAQRDAASLIRADAIKLHDQLTGIGSHSREPISDNARIRTLIDAARQQMVLAGLTEQVVSMSSYPVPNPDTTPHETTLNLLNEANSLMEIVNKELTTIGL